MNILLAIIYFFLTLVLDVFVFVLLLRLLFQKLGASWHNPISQFVIRFTEPVIKPLRRFIPGFRGFDLSIVFIVLALEIVRAYLLGLLNYKIVFGIVSVLIIAIANIGISLIHIYFAAILITVIISWLPLLQNYPLGQAAVLIANPFLKLFRRYIPPISGMDLSPLFALLLLFLINVLILTPLISYAVNMNF